MAQKGKKLKNRKQQEKKHKNTNLVEPLVHTPNKVNQLLKLIVIPKTKSLGNPPIGAIFHFFPWQL